MEPLTDVPSVPAGRPAVRAWRALDRSTRRALRRGEPYDDPAVAAVAVGYARTVVARSRLRRDWPVLLVVCLVATGLAAADMATGTQLLARRRGAALYMVLVLTTVLAIGALTRRRDLRLLRMENAGSAHLVPVPVAPRPAPESEPGPEPQPGAKPKSEPDAESESEPDAKPDTVRDTEPDAKPDTEREPGPAPAGRPVVFRYAPGALLRWYGTVIVSVALTQLIWLVPDARLLAVAATGVIGLLVAGGVAAEVLRHRPWRPRLVLGPDGLGLPAQGVTIGWSEITEIRVRPVPRGGRGVARHAIVAFAVGEPDRVTAGFRRLSRRTARAGTQAYGTPITVSDVMLDATAEQIVAAASGFTSAPVHRLR